VKQKQSFKQATDPAGGGSLAVRLHRGELSSDHGAAPPPATQQPQAKVVSLSAARARNSAVAAAKAGGAGGGWAAALASLGMHSARRPASAAALPFQRAPLASGHSSSSSLDCMDSAEAEKPAPPMQGFDLGSMLFRDAGLGRGEGGEDWEPYDPAAFAPGPRPARGARQQEDFPGLPPPPPAAGWGRDARAAERPAQPAPKSRAKKKTNALQDLAFLR